jgi:predicted RND superfamily exporter protein
MSAHDAVRYAFHTVGTALLVTTATLVAGFLVLSLSGFKVNSDIGLMTAITISLALALDFLFLPALLIMMEGKTHEAIDAKHSAHMVPAAAGCKRTDP